jgi:hypothetical protein
MHPRASDASQWWSMIVNDSQWWSMLVNAGQRLSMLVNVGAHPAAHGGAERRRRAESHVHAARQRRQVRQLALRLANAAVTHGVTASCPPIVNLRMRHTMR